ncbi:Holo-[acyl-carrier-protein] synthase [compost metagenome]
MKAFGCGIGQMMSFTDIAILPATGGKPECRLSEAAWKRLCLSPDNIRIHVTITHERTLASAFCIVERINA